MPNKLSSFTFGFLIFLTSLCHAAYVSNEVIVKFKEPVIAMPLGVSISAAGVVSIKSSDVAKRISFLNVQTIEKVFSDEPKSRGAVSQTQVQAPKLELIYKLTLPPGSNVETSVRELLKSPEIEYAHPNYILHALNVPNDPSYTRQWGLQKISAEAAWDVTTGIASITVAVVDTGIYYTHEDLSSKIVLGRNYVSNTNDPLDDNGHGTHLAGIIGAATNNSKGIAGLNWNCRVMAVKVLDSAGNGTADDVSRGINYAANNSANVINMSFGDYNDIPLIKDAIINAYSKGCILVAAAGNEGVSTPMYPAAYNDYVIAVAATDQNDLKSDWGTDLNGSKVASNYGSFIDVCAPGSAVYSTWLSDSYLNKNGTSMATPFVAGLASLILSRNQGLTQASVRQRIEEACDNIDSLNPSYAGLLGRGRINAARALGFPIAIISSPTNSSYVSGTISITGSALSSNLSKYQVLIGTGSSATLFETLFEGAQEINNSTLYTFNTSQKPDGLYTLKLVCQSTQPLTSEASSIITIDNINPAVDITSPASYESVAGTIKIEGTASDANLHYYTLYYSSDDINFTTIASSTTAVSNNTLGYWNTTGLSGQYTIKLTVIDLAQHATSKSIKVNISTTTTPSISIPGLIKSTPNPFNMSQQGQTYIHYNLSSNSPTTLYIFNITGELIYSKSFISGENGGKSGENLVPWDGRYSYGSTVGNGVYLYKIATGGRKVIGSGRVIVIRN